MRSRAHIDAVAHLSAPRLARYLAAAGGDEDAALDLYEWNTAASAAFFASLSWVEVALRNTLSEALERWCSELDGHWHDDPRGVFNGQTRLAIARARTKSQREATESPGRIVAELSFGFWRFLLTGAYQSTLWAPCLRHLFAGAKREEIESEIAALHILRNRIAHHEPIYDRDLSKDDNSIISLAERLHPRLAWLIDSRSGVPEVLRRPPRALTLAAAGGGRRGARVTSRRTDCGAARHRWRRREGREAFSATADAPAPGKRRGHRGWPRRER